MKTNKYGVWLTAKYDSAIERLPWLGFKFKTRPISLMLVIVIAILIIWTALI